MKVIKLNLQTNINLSKYKKTVIIKLINYNISYVNN